MKSGKIITPILIFLLTLGTVTALGYDVSIDIFPTHKDFDGVLVGEDESFLVFGYIYDTESLYFESLDDLKITVLDEDKNEVDSFYPEYVANSDSSNGILGYFFEEITIPEEGEYTIKVTAGSLSKSYRYVVVDDSVQERKISVDIQDYEINGNTITFELRVKNKDSSERKATVYLKGEKNFDSPVKFTLNLDADETKTIEKSYSLSEFGTGNFIVVAQAYVENSEDIELMSNPGYIQVVSGGVYTIGGTSIRITNLTIFENVFFPEDVVEGVVYIRNYGSSVSQYSFEYVFDNVVYKKGDVSYVEPGQTAEENFFLIIPNKSSIEVTFRIRYGSTYNEFKKIFLISEKTKFFFVGLEKADYVIDAGKTADVEMAIINSGNLDDIYSINVSGWDKYEIDNSSFTAGSLFLPAGEKTTVPITFYIPEDIRAAEYAPNITVCNSVKKCYTRSPTINVYKPESEQSIVQWNESFEEITYNSIEEFEYNISVKNIGSLNKAYEIRLDVPEGINYTIEQENFELGMDEEELITFKLMPEEIADYDTTLKIYSNDELIFERVISLKQKTGFGSGLSGMFFNQTDGPYMPALVILAIIGIGFLAYLSYSYVNKKVWTEKVLNYTPKRENASLKYPRTDNYGRIEYN